MNLFRFFSRTQSAPAARERLQVLLAHERASTGDSDLVNKLRDEILKAISKHMQIDDEKVRYFVIGYYVAVHNGLVRWIWKKLGVAKEPAP